MEKPDVDRVEGICPAIAIRQKNSVRNPRSTVGTMTEIHDYMRLLYARVGRTYCRQCGREVTRDTAEMVAARIGALPTGTRVLIGFEMPIVALAPAEMEAPDEGGDEIGLPKGDADTDTRPPSNDGVEAISETLNLLRRRGFGRLLIDGAVVNLDEVSPVSLLGRSTL